MELIADDGTVPNWSERGCYVTCEGTSVVVVMALSCGYGAGGSVLVSMESQSSVLLVCMIPQSNKSCAAGGGLLCMNHALSKKAWWLCFLIRPKSRSQYIIFWSVAMYPKKRPLKL